MRLTVLGAGPAYTDRAGATGASYLLSLDGTHFLLDLGQGSLPRLFGVGSVQFLRHLFRRWRWRL